ncbi:glutaredoxin family protein [Methanospirillum sp.]|jgi:glutaredoxin|uniref:glutaredoxin family protein n=1 Tax=Methanospirillum sp. TaxID=45200 RepID=UPI002D1FC01D|nr:glutaredoxin family protein [Methanospirillum sp.]
MITMGAVFIVYTLEFCPKCEILKDFLTSHQISFTVADMASAKSLTELRVNGIFVQEAPVLQAGKKFLTSKELFDGDKVNEQQILDLTLN